MIDDPYMRAEWVYRGRCSRVYYLGVGLLLQLLALGVVVVVVAVL
eukprot:COSAG05_NODE_1342_length_5140_cov_2.897838_10_plen_45_part_00